MKLLYIKHRSGKRMNNFAISAILAANRLGIDFTIANNMNGADLEHFNEVCKQYGIKMVHIDFDRNPLGIKNLLATKQLLELMEKEQYDIVHCNTPTGGVVGRVCARIKRIPYVIYQPHGFHFWKGAPLKNRMLYYPVEKFLAKWTNSLITINKEDFEVAKKFSYRKPGGACYVPGVGIDIGKIKLQKQNANRSAKRSDLGIPDDAFVMISVGELNSNKNHAYAIDAFLKAAIPNSYYIICGEGKAKEHLENIIAENKAADRIKLLGYRSDVVEILNIANLYIFPSKREGLSVALMEAMAMELPCAASKIRGNVDLLPDSKLIFSTQNEEELVDAMKAATDPDIVRDEVAKNSRNLNNFTMEKSVDAMEKIYLKAMGTVDSAKKEIRE